MRTTHTIALALALISSLSACALEARSEHLQIVGSGVSSSEEEVQRLLDMGEALHADVAALHPADVELDGEIRVELHGRYRRTSPYVDDEGTVHLWRFSEAEGGYRAMYAHELVHAIAYDSLVAPTLAESGSDAGFYLEGWAEYVALLVDPDKTGFPLFGFDEDVVVGHWLEQGGPTLAELRERHEELNMRCQGQAYILRASWFRYVDEELGREVVLDLAASRELDPGSVELVLGASLAQVDADWAAWAAARYDAYPDADAEAEAYRAQMGWYEPCL